MIRLVKASNGYYKVKTSLQLNEGQTRLLNTFLIPEHAMFGITYTGRTLNIGFTDAVGHQYLLSLNLKDGNSTIKEDYGIVRHIITHHADGRVEQEQEVGYNNAQ